MANKILFEELIKERYSDLSAAQKKATNYIFENLEKAAFNTAVQIGLEAGVSDSTVIRLSYALGFRSFGEMQSHIQQQIMDTVKPVNRKNNTESDSVSEDVNSFAKMIENEITGLSNFLDRLNIPGIEAAADAIISADQILIMGYYSAFTPAYDFYLKLSQMRPNVNFYRTTETEIQRLYSLNNESLVVAVSYPKHIKGTLKFTRQAQSQGAKVIAVTESELNALSLEAEIPFIVDVNVDDETCFSPMSETMLLFHLILMCVKAKNKDKILESIKNINTNLEKEDIYI